MTKHRNVHVHVAGVEELFKPTYTWSVSLFYLHKILMLEFPPDTCVCEWNISLVLVLADSVEFLKLALALQWFLVLHILYCYCHIKTI